MFTGIVSAIGRILHAEPSNSNAPEGDSRLWIETPAGYLDDVAIGDSITLDGACMTVTSMKQPKPASQESVAPCFCVDISAESLAKTTGLDQVQRSVNLEKALRAGDPLGGHIVSGHVDGIAQVAYFAPVADSWELRIQAPKAFAPFLAYKGSVTINGVSLTINSVQDVDNMCTIAINLIAHTLSHTTLGGLRVGDSVNLEVDTIARYVQRMLLTSQTGEVARFV